MNAVPRKFIYKETSFGSNQYLIELQPDGSLGLMSASGGSCKLDELKKILNPLSVCDTFPRGIFFEDFEC